MSTAPRTRSSAASAAAAASSASGASSSAPSASAVRGPFTLVTGESTCSCCKGSNLSSVEHIADEAAMRARCVAALTEHDVEHEVEGDEVETRQQQAEQISSGDATLEQAVKWVKEYQSRVSDAGEEHRSYWAYLCEGTPKVLLE